MRPSAVIRTTSCPTSSAASFRGRHSSRRMRTGFQRRARQFERRNDLLAAHRREVIEELVQAVSGLEVIDEVLEWDPRSDEHGRPVEDVRIAVNDLRTTG